MSRDGYRNQIVTMSVEISDVGLSLHSEMEDRGHITYTIKSMIGWLQSHTEIL